MWRGDTASTFSVGYGTLPSRQNFYDIGERRALFPPTSALYSLIRLQDFLSRVNLPQPPRLNLPDMSVKMGQYMLSNSHILSHTTTDSGKLGIPSALPHTRLKSAWLVAG